MKKVYFETYGCQMNINDSEIAAGILLESGYKISNNLEDSDIFIINTCSVRDNAEQKIINKLEQLKYFRKNKKEKLLVAVTGCMAERLGSQLIGNDSIVSIVVGPDSYRDLPKLISEALNGTKGISVELSHTETYSDIIPLRTEGISAWLSIMRGCDNFCSYCVVPFTRGRERSKDIESIKKDLDFLNSAGCKEITLLGQNVNSYHDLERNVKFPELLKIVAEAVPNIRIRFLTSHPYDLNDAMIEVMSSYSNICNYLHLPVQSGSNSILKAMNRKYSREHYLNLISKVKAMIPNCSLSTDIISGFPGETEQDHRDTLSLMETVKYDGAFMFNYSPRPDTKAYLLEDDVPTEIKKFRLNEIIELQNKISFDLNQNEIRKVHQVLVDSSSKKNIHEWQGRTDTNKVVIFDNTANLFKQGDYINLEIVKATSATLFGKPIVL